MAELRNWPSDYAPRRPVVTWLVAGLGFGVSWTLIMGAFFGFSLKLFIGGVLGGLVWSTFMSMRDPWLARGALACGIFLVPFMTVIGVMNWEDGHHVVGVLSFGMAGISLISLPRFMKDMRRIMASRDSEPPPG